MITLLPGVPDMCFCQKITVPTCMVAIWAIFKILYAEHFFLLYRAGIHINTSPCKMSL